MIDKRESTIDVLRRLSKQPPREPSKKYSAYDIDKLFDDGESFQPQEEKKQSAASSRIMELQKLDQVIARMSEIDWRMQKGDNYFNLYYEMQKLNTNFLELLKDVESKKIMIDDSMQKRITRIKESLDKRKMKE